MHTPPSETTIARRHQACRDRRRGIPAAALAFVSIVLALWTSVAGAQAPREAFDGCGEFVESRGCRWFYSYDRDVDLLIADFGGYAAGDTVHIVGTASISWESCAGIPFYWRLVPSVITRCQPSDLGCGVIVGDPDDGCAYWASQTHGRLDLRNIDGFASGDTVHVTGIICWCGGQTCHPFGDGEIRGAALAPCADSLSVVVPLTWGRLRTLFR